MVKLKWEKAEHWKIHSSQSFEAELLTQMHLNATGVETEKEKQWAKEQKRGSQRKWVKDKLREIIKQQPQKSQL